MRTKPELIAKLEMDMCLELYPTGARYFSDDADVDDWYMYSPAAESESLGDWLDDAGFSQCPESRTREFSSYEDDNGLTIFICWNEAFFQKFRLATRVCKSNGQLSQATREGSVNIFRTIFNFR